MKTPYAELRSQGLRYPTTAIPADSAPVQTPKTAETSHFDIGDAGPWFLFFFSIYAILLLKVITIDSIGNQIFFGAYSILISSYILSRFILAYLKKPVRYNPSYQPSISFVVPAKNEEDNIRETILRFADVEYPQHKIEVIVINDGSTDNTLAKMQLAANEIRNSVARVEVVDWKVNRGKRHGMAEGTKLARNDIIIFVDSDSFIERDCVKHLVKYFADPQVGAVSGHTDVHNRNTNILTKMQAVRYYISFKIYKAAESVFGFVTCCPGCCSAYRREYLMEYLDEWLEQRFLGAPCTFGDDRSLTNYMIRKYRAVYSDEALAYTVVPDSYGKYIRQQERWKKSWLRETFIAASFMWKKDPFAAISFYVYMFLTFASPVVFIRAMILHPLTTHTLPVIYLVGLFLVLLMHGLYYRLQVGKETWVLAISAFWLNAIILMWQLPWALLNIRDSRWGTR